MEVYPMARKLFLFCPDFGGSGRVRVIAMARAMRAAAAR
jgi:hypothetical protein